MQKLGELINSSICQFMLLPVLVKPFFFLAPIILVNSVHFYALRGLCVQGTDWFALAMWKFAAGSVTSSLPGPAKRWVCHSSKLRLSVYTSYYSSLLSSDHNVRQRRSTQRVTSSMNHAGASRTYLNHAPWEAHQRPISSNTWHWSGYNKKLFFSACSVS